MADPVNSSHVMWAIGQIADRDGVSKPAVSKTVAKLVKDHDLPVTRDARGRVATVSVAHYDHLRSIFGSSQQMAAPPASPSVEPEGLGTRDEALRQQAWLTLDRSKLEHQRDVSEVVRSDKVGEGLEAAGRAIQGIVLRLPNSADDLALAVSKEGTSGVRIALRRLATDMLGQIADALDGVAAGAPATDPGIGESDDQA